MSGIFETIEEVEQELEKDIKSLLATLNKEKLSNNE